MRPEAELAKDRIKEAPPLGVIGLLEVKDDWNVVPDVELLDDGGGSRRDDDIGLAVVIRGGVSG